MKLNFMEKLGTLCEKLNKPIYVVGGYVRNFLIDGSESLDIDLCAPVLAEDFSNALIEVGLKPLQVYKRTGTVVFAIENQKYEYTCFRKEIYTDGGEHMPISTEFTDSILEDALRRDFKCNAVYFDISKKEYVDPLGGITDIKNKVLDTVTSPEKVFCHDGLRLMRLARFCGELNFKSTKKVLESAKKYAENIKDISVERIYDEFIKILYSDSKYPFSDEMGHYHGLKILDETRVLDYIIPELAQGRDMEQRKDFHNHSVLEHTLKTVAYSPMEIRLSALFHDIGKPYCKQNYGVYHGHAEEGEKIARKVLERLKAPKKVIDEVCFLTANHMKDINGNMKAQKIKRLLIENMPFATKLIALMQADYSGCKDDLGISSTVKKWQNIYDGIFLDGSPLKIKDLKISAEELKEIGYKGETLGKVLKELFSTAIENPSLNEREKLKEIAQSKKFSL